MANFTATTLDHTALLALQNTTTSGTPWLYILIPIVAFLVLLAIVATIALMIQRRGRKAPAEPVQPIRSAYPSYPGTSALQPPGQPAISQPPVYPAMPPAHSMPLAPLPPQSTPPGSMPLAPLPPQSTPPGSMPLAPLPPQSTPPGSMPLAPLPQQQQPPPPPAPLPPPVLDDPYRTVAMAQLPTTPAPRPTPPPASGGVLQCLSGPLMGHQYEIRTEGIYIGRDGSVSQIVVSDNRVSKRHVWIGPRNGRIAAVDQGSTNGTFLNTLGSQRITEVFLNPGDTIIISEADVARFQFQK